MTQIPDPSAVAAPADSSADQDAGKTRFTGRLSARPGRIVALIAVAVIAFAAGGAISGSAVSAHDNTVAQAINAHVSRLQHRMSGLQAQLAQARQSAAQSSQVAQTATATAQAQMAAKYASRMAAVNSTEKRLAREQKTLRSELGQVQASAISADGVYVVGSDIKSGLWHTSGGGECYYATLSSTNTFDIIDNNNFAGPETVDVSGAYAFDISGGCTWVRAG